VIAHRPAFAGIEHGGLFYGLAALALSIFAWGVWRALRRWRSGGALATAPTLRALISAGAEGLAGRRLARSDPAAAVLHAAIAWGFLLLFAGTVLGTIDHQVIPFLRGTVYLVYSVVLEVAGLLLIGGLVWAMARRVAGRPGRLQTTAADLWPWLLLVVCTATGFLVEGLRLAWMTPDWAGWSFVGALCISALPPDAAAGMYPTMWWIHALCCLGLVAAMPWCGLRHALYGPLSLAAADLVAMQPAVELDDSGARAPPMSWREHLWLDACTRCGRCDEVCPPVAAGEAFSARAVVQQTRRRLLSSTGDDAGDDDDPAIWPCTTCAACRDACPIAIAPLDIAAGLRRSAVEAGTEVPAEIASTLERLQRYNNPWSASKKPRNQFAKELALARPGTEGTLCWFAGCTTAIETRAQATGRSFAALADQADVSLSGLGKREPCCGDLARSLGETGLYLDQAERCDELLDKAAVHELVVSSPHCYHTLSRERGCDPADNGASLRVRHTSEVLQQWLVDGRLKPAQGPPLRVTLHDPCYLARHHDIVQTPRQVLAALPGVELVEMQEHGRQTRCCGGGGGRMWQGDSEASEPMAVLRIRQAAATGAEAVITACPRCLIMLEDGGKMAGVEESLRVIDLNELVAGRTRAPPLD